MKALIIIDMVNDLVTGVLNNEKDANTIIPQIKNLLDYARSQSDWIVVFSNDAHTEQDPEMKVWGKHALAGTEGAKVIPELLPVEGEREYQSEKRFYGGFDQTNLEQICTKHGVTEIVLVGQHTHCCVRHTAYGGFIRSLKITVPRDCVCVFPGVSNEDALTYLQNIYKAEITTSEALINANTTTTTTPSA
eukprot:gene4060-5083_t